MANTKSALKRARQSIVKTERNQAIKSACKSALKKAQEAITSGDKEAAAKAVSVLVSKYDRAAKHGVVHKNLADRRKRRFAKAVAALG